MSSKIYFSDKNQRKNVGYYGVKFLSGTIARVAPRVGNKFARRLLLTPVRHNTKTAKPSNSQEYKLPTNEGDLHITELGNGPVVLFTHGWSGSTGQFYPLMEKVTSLGFKAVGFDHFAHGQSAGREANLPLFVKALEAVISHIDGPVVCTISHSMGCIAAVNKITGPSHVLIAPPFDFYTGFEQRILSTGLSKRLFEQVLKGVEVQHDMAFSALLPEQHLTKHNDILIVHDEEDRFAHYALSKQQASLHDHIELYTTQGLGHGRVINHELTWQKIATKLDAIKTSF
jgi:hypothetical protein